MSLRIGTRNSPLARWQAEWVIAQLKTIGVDAVIAPITTHGDQHQGPIQAAGSEGVFAKEIQRELLDGQIDVGVHSLKDLPTTQPAGLFLAAVPERGPVGDVLVCRKHASFDDLPDGVVVGTSSIRRRAQLLQLRPDLHIKDIRGNIDSRLRKLDSGEFDALVLAEAGLLRLGLSHKITQRFSPSMFLPAVGQGALGLEVRENDRSTRDQIAPLDHAASHAAVLAERTMLAALEGGCLAPVGGYARVDDQRLTLTGRVISCDGTRLIEVTLADALDPDKNVCKSLGHQVAHTLLAHGAADLIAEARKAV